MKKSTYKKDKLRLFLVPMIASSFGLSGCAGGGAAAGGNTSRFQVLNEPLALDTSMTTGLAISSTGDLSAMSLIPTITLVANVTPPTLVNGTLLQANDVTLSGTKAYIAYNVAGDTQAGGIDVINVAVPSSPTMSSSAVYTDMDVNKVFVSGSNLYTTGATSSGSVGPAILRKIALSSGNLTAAQTDYTLPSYAGTSVYANGSYIYALSGDGGGLTTFNASDMSVAATASIFDARDMGVTTTGLPYVLTGRNTSVSPNTNATIQKFTAAGSSTGAITLGATDGNIAQSKSTLIMGSHLAIAATGNGGVKTICIDNGAVIATIPAVTVSGVDPALTVTNAATFGNGLLITSNGQAGVYIYSVNQGLLSYTGTSCNQLTYTLIGSINFGSTTFSANNVYYAGNFLFVADGANGFRIVSVIVPSLIGLVTAL